MQLEKKLAGMLGVLLVCVVAIATGVAADDICPEDGRQYRIAPGDMSYGYVSVPSGSTCPTNAASLAVVGPPAPSNLLLLTGGWQYLFGAASDGPLPAIVNFTLSARCGEVEICRANIHYEIDPNAPPNEPVPQDPNANNTAPPTTTTTAAPRYPPCAVSPSEYQMVLPPGKTQVGTLPTTTVQVSCPSGYTASITQPSIGSAALLGPNSLQFVYSSPNQDIEANVTLPYEVMCTGSVVCGGAMQIRLHEDVPQCPKNELVYIVAPGAQLNATLVPGASCNGHLEGSVRSESVEDRFAFHGGTSFTFDAPEKEEDVIVGLRFYCDDESLCDTKVGFVVTNETRPTTTKPPEPETTPSPATPPVEKCDEQFTFVVPTGKQLRGTLHVDLQNCTLVTYHYPRGSSSRDFQVNIIGDFLYVAPTEESIDVLSVDVSCITKFYCRTQVVITSYDDMMSTPSPTSPPPTIPPVPSCANVYYYQTAPGVALSNSLNGMPGQDPCVYGRYFSLINPPKEGTLEMTPIGDFLYRPPMYEGPGSFSFSMYCLNKLYCQGNAYILVSTEWTLPPGSSGQGPNPSSPPPVSNITNPQIKCRGTCNERAWMTTPKVALWDNTPGRGYARGDGHAVDGIQVAWANNSIIITVYTIIGNLGVRFPTFEPFDRMTGKFFEPGDFKGVAEASSLGFELSCLANQGKIGMGEDVWRWKTLSNGTGTGSVGALYKKGTSWYQKFGGKHIGCDTFMDSCHYAPLLTPAVPKTGAVGQWEIEIDDCDATWTGTFPYASLEELKKSDGSPVWYFVGDRQIKGTIISECVRPNSWIEPARSFDSHYEAHDVIFDLHHFIVVNKQATVPFSIDSEFFEYTENGDRAFGVNLLLHPYVTDNMETSYSEDRHVSGFKWITQDWIAPGTEQCPTCKGNKTHCSAEGKYATSTYTGEFPPGDCPQGVGRIELSKGPAMDTMCPTNLMHVYNRSGFSTPSGCATWFQNLTIRGVAIGSADLPDALKRAFNYEGRVVLQLLMTDGTKHDVTMDLSMYVTRLSQDSYAAAGGLRVCRGSDYWPVLDPLGTSLPDTPFELSIASPKPLCIDTLSSTFGPSGWATVYLQLPGVNASQVNVHSVVVRYNGTSVYLLYQDPATGVAAIPPKAAGYWWQYTHPFLSFRDLTNRVANGTITTGPSVGPVEVADVPFAFTFIPGAINIATNMEVIVQATITTDIVSTSTFCRMVHVDPMMTHRSRYGPPPKITETTNANKEEALAMGAIAGVAIAVTITGVLYATMDNNRPLPKWVPRGKLIKNTVLAAVPAGLRPAKKEKRVVHKDMYDAMKSGKY
ncbi:hypothetical protein DQ04_00371060 [Trypanosoma grayi]|uniref:hypothetical protein n=1 Tax=Trypanosoma grayi TaxID=71804 RepID=UPI0004F4265B|nr:hypothetical protein DQ04_00371060 [Trypanosoma grayi]KEG14620.1 hypothetical protein DQ04_00371060 [Trypanosoma grayi]